MRRDFRVPGSRPSSLDAPEARPGSFGRTIAYILLAFAGLAVGLVIYIFILLGQPLRTSIDIVDADSVEVISLDDIQLTEDSGDSMPWDQGGRTRVYVHDGFPIKKVKQKDPDVETILVFGVDSRKASDVVCRADTIILVTINKTAGSIKLTSILRDTQVEISGRSKPNRINAAYAFGGVGLLINTLNETFGLDIQRFAMFDFWSAASLIDSLGGVELNVSKAEMPYLNLNLNEQNKLVPNATQSPQVTEPGLQMLNGQQAIAWARIRKLDSDYMRASRQRTVMTALIGKYADSSVAGLISLTSSGLSAFETNMTSSDMLRIGISSLPLAKKLEDYRVPEDGMFTINTDPWVMIVDLKQQVPALHDFIWSKP